MFLAPAVALLAACPSTAPSALRIDTVEVDGDARGAEFDVLVTGRGFIRRVAYDLAAGEGAVLPDDLTVMIRGVQQAVEIEPEFTVLGPTNLRVFMRNGPLPPQTYQIVLFLDGEEAISAVAFVIEGEGERDGGVPEDDGGGVDPDGGDIDGGVERDAGPRDGGPPRDAGPPDSGLGEFEGAFGYRRLIDVNSGADIPAGVTIKIPVPHATLVNEGKSEDTALDLVVYQGRDVLQHAFDDRLTPNTDSLVIIAKILRDIPAAGAPDGDALSLYYADPNVNNLPTDGVFEFVHRFDNNVSPVDNGDDDAWSTNDWSRCGLQRPVEAFGNTDGNYCIGDGGGNPYRRTLGTPRIRTLSATAPANVTYEASFYITAQFIDGLADILYFSHAIDNDDLEASLLFPAANYVEFAPNHTLTFEERNGADRTVEGWTFPPSPHTFFQRVRLRFRPMVDQPSLHFRYVSTNGNSDGASGAGLDDFWVRAAPEPAPAVVLGPEEARNP